MCVYIYIYIYTCTTTNRQRQRGEMVDRQAHGAFYDLTKLRMYAYTSKYSKEEGGEPTMFVL
jgi:hypothetical protein